MHFGKLILIHLFWIIPALIFFLVWSFRRKQVLMQRFAHIDMLKRMLGHVSISRQYFKASLIVATLVFLILALMEPQWGIIWEKVQRRGIDVIVAVDVSRSMLATDEKPNRLERAKRAILDLLNLMDGDRIGLIAFAGSSFVQCPLTLDYGAAKMFVNEIEPQLIPRGGTHIGDAIRKSISAFEGDVKKHRALILITDGEDHESDPIGAAKEARKKGIRIFCIGLGSPRGSPIQMTDEKGNMTYLKDSDGNQVLSKLDETTLQQIALETRGAYVHAQSTGLELDEIYTQRIAEMEKKDLESRREKRYEHRFQWPLSIAAVLLIFEAVSSDKQRKPPQDNYTKSV